MMPSDDLEQKLLQAGAEQLLQEKKFIRPSAPHKRTIKMTFFVSPEERRRIHRAANYHRTPRSTYLREIVFREIRWFEEEVKRIARELLQGDIQNLTAEDAALLKSLPTVEAKDPFGEVRSKAGKRWKKPK